MRAGSPARKGQGWEREQLTTCETLVAGLRKGPADARASGSLTNAAVLFHELSRAYDILSDPAKRAEYDASVRAKLERRKRHEQLDSKRRKLKDGTPKPLRPDDLPISSPSALPVSSP